MQAEGGSSDVMKQNDSLQRSKYLSSGDFSHLTNKPILQKDHNNGIKNSKVDSSGFSLSLKQT
jgi:hypothetical protein